MYVEYTLYFNHREAQRKITSLEQSMANMDLRNQRLEKYVRSLGVSLEEVKDQNEELLEKNEELLDNNKGLNKEVRKVQRKLGIAVEDRAPLPDDKKKQERFVLIKRNDPDYLPYYTIRAQSDYTSRRLRSQKALFPEMEILLDFKSNPNSKTLYVRIKDNLKARGVTFEGNNIDLNEAITEEDLVDEMMVINDQKYDVTLS
jgi:signal recognition particle subunit SEC65